MADSGRLDELLRKFDENPRRYFAPLANEYRKAGELERAIELCRTYLPQQPGHMSGYIVYGQSLFDAGRDEEAGQIFRQALELDPENIIALRHLGDIARRSGDRAEAMQWYGRVLEFDPKNEEIVGFITEMASPDENVSAPPPAPPPAVRPEPEPDPNAVALSDLMEEPERPQPSFESTAYEPTVYEPAAHEAEPHGPTSQEPAYEPPFEAMQFESLPRAEEEPLLPPVPAEPLLSPIEQEEPLLPRIPEEEPEAPMVSAVPEAASPFVTETMAELYVQQGFVGEALDVYRKLAESRGEARLWDKVRELEERLEQELEPSSSPHAATQAAAEVHVGAHFEAQEGDEVLTSPRVTFTVRDLFARFAARRSEPSREVRPDVPQEPAGGLAELFPATPVTDTDVRAATSLSSAFAFEDPDA